MRLQQFLYFVLKGVDFATYRTIDLLQVLQIGYIVVYIEQSHELVVLRAELVELTLYFLYIALHLNINDSSHYSHTLTLYIKREWAVNEEIWAASVLSASTAKSHSKTKSFYITTKRPNISAAPNVPRNSPALTPCCNTHAVNTTNRYREDSVALKIFGMQGVPRIEIESWISRSVNRYWGRIMDKKILQRKKKEVQLDKQRRQQQKKAGQMVQQVPQNQQLEFPLQFSFK